MGVLRAAMGASPALGPHQPLATAALLLVLLGLAVVAVSSALMLMEASWGGADIAVGGCVVVFFIPICFGVGEGSWGLVLGLVSATVALAAMSLFLVFGRKP